MTHDERNAERIALVATFRSPDELETLRRERFQLLDIEDPLTRPLTAAELQRLAWLDQRLAARTPQQGDPMTHDEINQERVALIAKMGGPDGLTDAEIIRYAWLTTELLRRMPRTTAEDSAAVDAISATARTLDPDALAYHTALAAFDAALADLKMLVAELHDESARLRAQLEEEQS